MKRVLDDLCKGTIIFNLLITNEDAEVVIRYNISNTCTSGSRVGSPIFAPQSQDHGFLIYDVQQTLFSGSILH